MADKENVRSLEDIAIVAATKKAQSADSTDASLPDVSSPSSSDPVPLPERKVDKLGRSYATGKRKGAIARVWLKPGSGMISVNGKREQDYFARAVLRMIMNQPFKVAGRAGQYDTIATVCGGGLSGQAGAVRHGLSKALVHQEPGLRPVLKKNGFLTRDSRVVERKKYGRAKARRSFQFSKR